MNVQAIQQIDVNISATTLWVLTDVLSEKDLHSTMMDWMQLVSDFIKRVRHIAGMISIPSQEAENVIVEFVIEPRRRTFEMY